MPKLNLISGILNFILPPISETSFFRICVLYSLEKFHCGKQNGTVSSELMDWCVYTIAVELHHFLPCDDFASNSKSHTKDQTGLTQHIVCFCLLSYQKNHCFHS